ncbi:amidase [Amycolatopsis sp. YIM 10]|uniref:amidase n=1 Tax=Amycolatopsis sp. YIM 10 TaxID=2653857 RepID=UPI00129051D4|nr:amidase [Amycolatopsis sp. YIM 10]QFU92841.1 Glutamyl-tRNA(Gln) amidotransferase subunit A [Amycolatopsis sp. YIM 10]
MPGLEALARSVRDGEVDPVELLEGALARAEARASLNAVVHVDRSATARADGPLAGIPVLVKEIIEVGGLPFRCGSEVFADRIGAADAEIVARVRAAGGVVFGLTHSHEFAYGCTGTANRAGPCRNPHDPSRIAGGSSSGSAAAVAAGIAGLALGTDTAGSVRVPASLCGVVGAKPSRGLLPADGVFPLSRSLDHVGVFTGSVADARYAVEVLGRVSLPALTGSPRLGVVEVDASPAVTAAFDECLGVLEAAGARLTRVDFDWDEINRTAVDLQGPEAAAVHAELLSERYQPDVRDRLRAAAEVPGWRYVLARERVRPLTDAVERVLSEMDGVVLPAVPMRATPIGDESVREPLLRYNRLANLTGFPALSLPMPVRGGLPAGMQVLGTDDARVFGVAEWVENALVP